jgi:hypothetical protein
MGLVTGTTTHKLDQIRTYNPLTPYVVGTNGVTALYTDIDGFEVVEYTINGIYYKTTILQNIIPVTKPIGVTAPDFNVNPKSYIPLTETLPPDRNYPTTFSYTTTGVTGDNNFIFKEEAKMGVVFTPKVYEDVFIERQRMSIFESQSRLSVILSLEDLEEYNNGYYNIVKTE